MAFSRIDDPERASVKTTASRCLEKAVEYKLIKATPEGESKPISKEVLTRLLATFAPKKEKEPEPEEKREADQPTEAKMDEMIEKIVKRGQQIQAGTPRLQENDETPHKLTITELPDDAEVPVKQEASTANGEASQAKSTDTPAEESANKPESSPSSAEKSDSQATDKPKKEADDK